jgi:hypothetical protein
LSVAKTQPHSIALSFLRKSSGGYVSLAKPERLSRSVEHHSLMAAMVLATDIDWVVNQD